MPKFIVEVTGKYQKGTDAKKIEKTEKAIAKEFKAYAKKFMEGESNTVKIKITEAPTEQ